MKKKDKRKKDKDKRKRPKALNSSNTETTEALGALRDTETVDELQDILQTLKPCNPETLIS